MVERDTIRNFDDQGEVKHIDLLNQETKDVNS